MHFGHCSAKIQLKNQKLVHYKFLAVRGKILIGGGAGPPLSYALGTA